MRPKYSTIQKIAAAAEKSIGSDDYKEIINKISDKEALALAVVTLDKAVAHGGFSEWKLHGYGSSKRAMRILNNILPEIGTPEARAVLAAKTAYAYSISQKQNILSTQAYRKVREPFMKQANKFVENMA